MNVHVNVRPDARVGSGIGATGADNVAVVWDSLSLGCRMQCYCSCEEIFQCDHDYSESQKEGGQRIGRIAVSGER
jgi:hypothetical protein